MSAPDTIPMQRSFTIDGSAFPRCSQPTFLPHSISAIERSSRSDPTDVLKTAIADEQQLHGAATCTSSPFCSASGIGAVLAGENDASEQQPSQSQVERSLCSGLVRLSSASMSATCVQTSFTAVTSMAAQSICTTASTAGPSHGVKALCGKRTKMEDAHAVHTNFFDLAGSKMDTAGIKLPARIASQLELTLKSAMHMAPARSASMLPMQPGTVGRVPSMDKGCCDDPEDTDSMLHFYAVYDGHGGHEAASHCADRLHVHLSDALTSVLSGLESDEPTAMVSDDQACHAEPMWMCMSPAAAEPVASLPACCGMGSEEAECLKSSSGSADSTETKAIFGTLGDCSSNGTMDYCAADTASASVEAALHMAFLKIDDEFASNPCALSVGSTAVVALVSKKTVWVANCGDSRAVLCRAGMAIPLTDDHKPERKDETERVEKAGGHILYWGGARVMGILAMSRAIGDHGLRPYVIPDPEVTVVPRTEDDNFLLLASDGLWDVLSNQEAADLASRCLTRAVEKGAGRRAAFRIAASVLTKAAIDRGSKDNVTVVIVDLAAGSPSGDAMPSPVTPHQPAPQPAIGP